MVSGPDSDQGRFLLPGWLPWFQLGLTSMLVVLFMVLLSKGREQGHQLRLLEQRLQGLENSRSLDRSSGVEQQLHSVVKRLQTVEGQGERVEALGERQQQLEQELLELKNAATQLPVPRAQQPTPPPVPSQAPPPRARPQALTPGSPVLRPPARETF